MADEKFENGTIFSRLTKLFRSGPIIKRKVMSYDTTVALGSRNRGDKDGMMLFQKSTNMNYTEALAGTYQFADRIARYQDFGEMEYCLSGDTKIAVPGGFKTLKELSDEYGIEKEFTVFSYDHSQNKLVPAIGRQARKTKTEKSFKVIFKDNTSIIGSGNHRLMLLNGTYCRIDNLRKNDRLMPYVYSTESSSNIKIHNLFGGESGWSTEKEFLKTYKKCDQNQKIKNVSIGNIIEAAERCDFVIEDIANVFDITIEDINELLNQYNFRDFNFFVKTYRTRKNKLKDKKTWENLILNIDILNGIETSKITKEFGFSREEFIDELNKYGYEDIYDFHENFFYKEVLSIEENGVIDLYDLTVDGYKNFATDTVISHNTPEIAAALDLYSDEICAQDDKGRTLHVFSNNNKIKRILEDLFYNTLNVEFALRSWARSLCKYGDFFLFNEVSPKYGVINAFPIPVSEIEREENFDSQDPYAVRFRMVNRRDKLLENWEVSHMRLLGNDMFLPYGSSIIEPARRIWRQLVLIEDAMLVYRLVRAPERRVFYVDVGNLPAENVPTYVEQLRRNLKTQQVVDKSSGRIDLRYNPQSIEEDYFIPVRGSDTGTKIESLAGGQNTSAVEDVEYLQKKLFAALKIPRAYLGYDESIASKSTLAAEDIRFSRTINVIQRTIISELNKLAIIHLFANGYDGDDLMDFVLHLSNPSTIAQIQKMELLKTKFELAGAAPEGMFSKTWVRKEILGLTDDQIDLIDEQRITEKLKEAEIENATAEEEEEEPVEEEGGGEEEITAEEEGGGEEEVTAEEEGGGEESVDDILGSLEARKNGTFPIKPVNTIFRDRNRSGELIEEDVKDPTKKYYRKYKKNRKRRRINKEIPNLKNISDLGSSLKDPFDRESTRQITKMIMEDNQPKFELSQSMFNMLLKMNQKLSIRKNNGILVENEILNNIDDGEN